MFNPFKKLFGDRSAEASSRPGLRDAVAATGKSLLGSLRGIFQGGSGALDESALDEIEEILLRADVGLDTAVAVTDKLRREKNRIRSEEALLEALKAEFSVILCPPATATEAAAATAAAAGATAGADIHRLRYQPGVLNLYLVVGVNGAGKTTFIGKLAHHFVKSGQKVVIAAGDTFRAAAEDQLAIWAERSGADLVRKDGADPAAVIYDALETAKAQNADVLLVDTAGRLQNKFNLMEELRKIRQVIQKGLPENAVYESLLVLDATTGQNALKQAEVFKEAVDISGVVLTKLDGSAKGGIVLTIAREYHLPVKLVGVGEGIEDLRPFEPREFLDALFDGARLRPASLDPRLRPGEPGVLT